MSCRNPTRPTGASGYRRSGCTEMAGRVRGPPETAEYRVFVWPAFPVLPDKKLIVIARDEDLMFGLPHGRFHEGIGSSGPAALHAHDQFRHLPIPRCHSPGRQPDLA